MDKILEVKNLSFKYGNNIVLDDISFYMEEGDYVGIIGPNGSAKSTLMKLTLGLLKPLSGSISFFKEDINKFKDYEKIGYISQNVRDFNKMFPGTVEEIVSLNTGGSFFNKKDKDKVEKALKIVDMYEYKDRKIGNLSGGQKQRVFIARAILNNPKILFMDEPLVGVDLESQKNFYRLMDKLNKEYNMTLVMISHDIDTIIEKANKILSLKNGKLYSHNTETCDCAKKIEEIYGESMDLLLQEH